MLVQTQLNEKLQIGKKYLYSIMLKGWEYRILQQKTNSKAIQTIITNK